MSAILQTKTLFISAGHSDTDPGATGHGYTEADIVLEFRDLVADYLRGKVVFAKDGEPGQNLPLRTAAALAAKHDVAVEFHCNAFNGQATGVETLSRTENYPLGRQICEAIADTLGIPNRGAKPEGSGQHSRLAFASSGGIIVELFFIDNRLDLQAYQSTKHELAKIVAGVLINEAAPPGAYRNLE